MTTKLRVKADASRCCGYAACVAVCPQFYRLNENGIVSLAAEIVPDELEELAIAGAEVCPQRALTVEEVDE